MREVVSRYGITVPRDGYISCPFHREKTASCYIEKQNFHCFGCGAHGDIFQFVQLIEGISFKEAFISLGGTYERPTSRAELYAQKLRLAEIKRQQELKENEMRICKRAVREASKEMEVWRPYLKIFEPMTEDWLYAMERFSKAMNDYDNAFDELQSLKQ